MTVKVGQARKSRDDTRVAKVISRSAGIVTYAWAHVGEDGKITNGREERWHADFESRYPEIWQGYDPMAAMGPAFPWGVRK